MTNESSPLRAAIPLAALLVFSPFSFGAGFQLAERSAAGLGRAFSGEAAIADNASIVASNPAGMILLDGTSVSAGLSYIIPNIDVKGTAFTPAPLATRDNDVLENVPIPYLYAAHKLNDRTSVGLGVFTTHGLRSNYKPGPYLTDYSDILTININPSVAYRLNDHFTIGAGLDILYTDVELTATSPGVARILDLEGDDWGFGFNLGVLFELNENTRAGLHYRSQVDIELEGNGTFLPAGIVGADAKAKADLPDTIEFSVYHNFGNGFAVHGDVLWTNWEDFETLAPTFSAIPPVPFSNDESWENTFRLSVGATYEFNDKLTARCGFAWDESPVPDAARTTLRIPDADRYWASVGLTYRLSEAYTLDLGYTHLFGEDSKINEPAGGNGNFVGEATGGVDILAFGLNGTF